jgi:hypothetical protein
MTREDRQEFQKILYAHAQTIAICEACAATTRDLAGEVARGSVPRIDDLHRTVGEAERVIQDLAGVRAEVERLIATLS